MRNLDERIQANGFLWCPYGDQEIARSNCIRGDCAHYNPDAKECVYIEAVRAQVRTAEALTGIYSLLKHVVVEDGCIYVKEC